MKANWPWRGVAGVLLAALLSALWLPAGVPLPTARAAGSAILAINQIDDSAFPDVTAYVTVSDGAGMPVAGLPQDAFGAAEDGRPITGFRVQAVVSQQRGIALILALDLSGSMKGSALDAARSAAKALVNALGPQDTVAILGFSEQVRWLQDSTTDRASALRALDGMTAQGDTALNDAIYEAAGRVGALPAGRRVVVVLTDGRDTASTISQDRAITQAQAMQAPIFTIGFGPEINASALGEIALQTGGSSTIAPSLDQLSESFQRVLRQLKQQYALSFRSSLVPDMREHELLVRVTYSQDTFEDQKHFLARAVVPVVDMPGLASGQQVKGKVRLTPRIVSATAIRRVTYLVDARPVAEITASPFEWEWDTTTVTPGQHGLEVRATDESGRESAWRGQLLVAPPLSVRFVSPAEGDSIGGDVILAIRWEAVHDLAQVEYLRDGQSLFIVKAAPFQVQWRTDAVPMGEHQVLVRALDVLGNQAQDAIKVTVTRPSEVTPATPEPRAVSSGTLKWQPILLALLAVLLVASAAVVGNRLLGARQKSPAALIWQLQSGDQHRLPLKEGENTIGKLAQGNTVVVDAPTVSRVHAVIRIDSARASYQFRNLSVKSVSVVNGTEVTDSCALADGDQIELGDEVLTFVVEGKP